jgi:hypothetical protein
MSLTDPQIATFKTALFAETNPTLVAARDSGADGAVAAFYNGSHPTFIVWKSNVPITQVGDKFNGTELGGLTSANQTRLQTIAQFSSGGVNPSLADRRAFFDDIFSGAGGATTRANLLALWKRAAKRGEAIFATGTGSDVSPGTLVFEGNITSDDVVRARQ